LWCLCAQELRTPLLYATKFGHVDIVKVFLGRGLAGFEEEAVRGWCVVCVWKGGGANPEPPCGGVVCLSGGCPLIVLTPWLPISAPGACRSSTTWLPEMAALSW
jgi:hypothetical protein